MVYINQMNNLPSITTDSDDDESDVPAPRNWADCLTGKACGEAAKRFSWIPEEKFGTWWEE